MGGVILSARHIIILYQLLFLKAPSLCYIDAQPRSTCSIILIIIIFIIMYIIRCAVIGWFFTIYIIMYANERRGLVRLLNN